MGKEILALAAKDVRLLLRDKGGAFVTFVFPFVYCVFFGLIFAARNDNAYEIGIAVVDEDHSELSTAFTQRLDNAGELSVQLVEREEAINLVRLGKRVAYVLLPKGFGQASRQILFNRHPKIEIGVDPARTAEVAMIRGVLTKYAFETVATMFADRDALRRQVAAARMMVQSDAEMTTEQRGVLDRFFVELGRFATDLALPSTPPETPGEVGEAENPLAGWRPIEFSTAEVTRKRKGPANSYEISFPQGIIWGVLGCCASFGVSMVIERTSGTLSRLRMAPIGRIEILAGKALACFVSTLSLAVFLFVIGWLFFGITPRSVVQLAISLTLISTAFVGIMMFLSILGKTERAVSGIGWSVLLGMAMLGGGMVPSMFMPRWMQTWSHVSPVKWAILAMEGAVWRDFSIGEMLLPWGILLLVGVVFFAIGVKGFAWTDDG